MTNEKVLAAVSALCQKYSNPPVPGKEVKLADHGKDKVAVLQAVTDLRQLSGKLGLSSVYPELNNYLTQLGQNDIKLLMRKDLIRMLIDGMPALSNSYEENLFLQEYGKDLSEHVDSSKVLARDFDRSA